MSDWNEDKVEEALAICSDIYDVKYELENSERGAFTGCSTYKELGEYLQELGDRLIAAGQSIASEEEDDELNEE